MDWTSVASALDETRPLFPNINGGLSFPYTVVNGGGGVVTDIEGLPASDAVVLADNDVTFAFGQSVAPYTGTPALVLESFDNGSTTGLAVQRFRPESGVTNNAFTIFNDGVAVVTGILESVDVFTFPVNGDLDSFANVVIQLTGVPGGADPTIYNELLIATRGSGTLFVSLSTFDFEGDAPALDDGSIFVSEGEIDGLTSGAEAGLQGWTIYVDMNEDGDLDIDEPSAVTDANGQYQISNLPPVVWFVREVAQTGWKASFDSHEVFLVSGQTSFANFGNFVDGFGTVSGVKWNDLDNDGTRDTSPELEPGLSGWTIFVDLDDDGVLDAGEPSAVTSGDGSYSIANVPSGRHFVTEVRQLGWGQTTGDTFSFVAANGTLTVNFGNRELVPGSIGGSKWNDHNGDGLRASHQVQVTLTPSETLTAGEGSDSLTDAIVADLSANPAIVRFAGSVGNNPNLVSAGKDVDLYKFVADANDVITATVFAQALAGGSSLDSWLRLFDAAGNELRFDDDSAFSVDSRITYTIPTTGTYYIGVSGYGNRSYNPNTEGSGSSGDTGIYELQITSIPLDSLVVYDDEALAGWTIYVDLNDNHLRDEGEPFAVTASDDSNTPNVNETGRYLIPNVPAGVSVFVREEPQAGWAASRDQNILFVVEGGLQNNVDFANYIPDPATGIHGIKWNDHNGDGDRQSHFDNDLNATVYDDEALAGWTIYVDQDNDGLFDAGEPSAVTDSNGEYAITGLLAGTTHVREVAQEGWVPSLFFSGDHQVVNLLNGQQRVADFANVHLEPGTISGLKWHDRNSNYIRDVEEEGLAGWTIYIDADEDGMLDPDELRAVTREDDLDTPDVDETGRYTIQVVGYGEQSMREVPQAGWVQSAGDDSVFLYNGGQLDDINFGNFLPVDGTVSGLKWSDLNADGDRDSNEPLLAGWTIYVDENNDGQFNPGEPSAVTASDDPETPENELGTYTINGVQYGDQRIREVSQAGWTVTYPDSYYFGNGGTHFLFVFNGQDVEEIDFGNFFPAVETTISGTKWNDLNANYDRDPGEEGLAGWTIYADLNANGVLNVNEPQDVTDADGNYTLSGFPAGYEGYAYLREVAQTGWTATVAPYFYGVYLYLDGVTITGQDFANYQARGNLAGLKWEDLDGDGVRDIDPNTGEPTEPTAAGWTIYLDLDFDGVFDTEEPSRVTGEDGTYAFLDVPSGYAVVREVPQLGWQATSGDTGLNIPVGDTVTKNFGNRHLVPGTITGTKWNDLNGDGYYYSYTEPGLPGWTIYVDLNNDNDRDAGEPFAVTAEDDPATENINETGTYIIGNIPAGSTLWLREEAQAGWVASRGDRNVYIYENYTQGSQDFGNYQPDPTSGIKGIKYHDHNGDGSRAEGDEALAGWTIFLDLDNDGELDAGEVSTITATDDPNTADVDETGSYSFSELLAGNHRVAEVAQAGWRSTPYYGDPRTVFVYNGSQSTIDFANFIPVDGFVSGVKWHDLDGNQSREPNEPPLAGWTIYLDTNNNSEFDVGEPSAVTQTDDPNTPEDETGHYTITGVEYGGARSSQTQRF